MVVSELRYTIEGARIRLTFRWPSDVKQVVIFRRRAYDDFDPKAASVRDGRVFTLDEYKTFFGYLEEIEFVDLFTYYIYPIAIEDGEMSIILPDKDEEANAILTIMTGKIPIRFEIHEKKKPLSDKKTVTMTIITDREIDKKILCYVKKKGRYPSHREDGACYSFAADFCAGRNVMPPIPTARDEYIRIFVADEEKYGGLFKPEYA